MSLLSKQNGNLLLTVFAAFALSVLPAWTAGKNAQAYVFSQRDVEVGRSTVYLSHDAVRIVNLDHGFEILTAAPDWKVTFLRRAEKKQHVTTLKEFRYFSIFGQLDTDWNRYDHLPVRAHEEKEGLMLAKYFSPSGIEIYMVENLDVAPEVGQFLQCYYHTPLAGVPFRSVYHFGREVHSKEVNWLKNSGGDFSGPKPWLITIKVQRTPYLASDFDCPVGYKTIKDQTLMILSNTKLDSFDSVVKELTAEDQGKKLQQLRQTAKP